MVIHMRIPDKKADVLRCVFGFDKFRPGQEEVIEVLLAGRSALAIFPTGSGKSICYQIPAMLLDGLTLVISPLIALMKDQLDFLNQHNVPAARLDSTLDWDESRQVLSDLCMGRLKLLFVAPERLASERFLQTLRRLKLSLMAVDEAHCISEWGHNFRPDYLKLARLARQLKVERILALTATATPSVARDIARIFGIADADVVYTGFYRPNLNITVTPVDRDRDAVLLERLKARPRGSTIVYVTLQKTSEMVAEFLTQQGLSARPYHAGLDAELRHEVQDWFMGSTDAIVVATIAFGMGIDKPDIRYVYHYNLPKTLENYAQEIGRAGRDGRTSICQTLACPGDATVLENFTYGDTPTPQAVGALISHVLSLGQTFDVSLHDLSYEFDIRPLVLETALTYLELAGLIESTGPFYNEYKFQPKRPSSQILARFSGEPAAFLHGVLCRARKAKVWFTLDLDQIALDLNQPRQRIISAINDLEEQGDIVLQVAGARQGYRRKKVADGPGSVAASIVRRFAQREDRDIERVREVLRFVGHDRCYTQALLAHFGEQRDACGHCGICEGQRPATIRSETAAVDGSAREAIRRIRDERHESLASPRQMARFLCGIHSPRTTRAKLTRHELFGTCEGMPFGQILRLAEEEARLSG